MQSGKSGATIENSLEGISGDAIREHLECLLASPEFFKSVQLSSLLKFIVETALRGETESLKESSLGLEVFQRPPGYDPKIDPIVRVEVRRLRAKLDQYYERRGTQDPIRITLPKGGYVPVFEASTEPPGEPGEPEVEPEPLSPVAQTTRHKGWLIAAAALVVAVGSLIVVRSAGQNEPAKAFWSGLLGSRQPCILVPADSGLVMLQNQTRLTVSLKDYMTGEYLKMLRSQGQSPTTTFGNRRYTSIVDLQFATRLTARKESAGLRIRYARDLRLDDIKGAHLIFLGAKHSNPWIELYEGQASLRIAHDEASNEYRVLNLTPQPGEREFYQSVTDDPIVYGLITFHPSPDGSGQVLTIGGTTMAGTEAATDFILNDQAMRSYLEKAKTAQGFHGFDLLVQSRNLAGGSPQARVVAFHLDREKSPMH